jgi:hypothetical protein
MLEITVIQDISLLFFVNGLFFLYLWYYPIYFYYSSSFMRAHDLNFVVDSQIDSKGNLQI